MAEPRSLEQRTADARQKLRSDVDLWAASADAVGGAHLVPLSFLWDGAALSGRALAGYVYLRLVPDTIDAWRSPEALPGRTVMRDGRWLAS